VSHCKPDAAHVAELHVLSSGPESLPDPACRGAMLDIVVSDALARYWILDQPAGLASAAELDLYAVDRFNAIFGDDPAQWVLRVDPLPHAASRLACAIPALYATDLPGYVADRGWQARRVETRFIREFNRHCRALGRDAVFCVAANDSTTIGLIEAGTWRGIRVHPPLDKCAAGFSTLLRRDARQACMSIDGLLPVVVGSLKELVR
jgi:hypothetical protein